MSEEVHSDNEYPQYSQLCDKLCAQVVIKDYDANEVRELFKELFKELFRLRDKVGDEGDIEREAVFPALIAEDFLRNNIDSAIKVILKVLVAYTASYSAQSEHPSLATEKPLKQDAKVFANKAISEWLDKLPIPFPSGGRPEEWHPVLLQEAIIKACAAPIPFKRRSYKSIAEKIRSPKPLTAEALEQLVRRKGLKDWWDTEIKGRNKQNPT